MDIDFIKIIVFIVFVSKFLTPILKGENKKGKKNNANRSNEKNLNTDNKSKPEYTGRFEDSIGTSSWEKKFKRPIIGEYGVKNPESKAGKKKKRIPASYGLFEGESDELKTNKSDIPQTASQEGHSLEGYSMNMKPFGTEDPKYDNEDIDESVPLPGEVSYEDLYKQVYGSSPLYAFEDKTGNRRNELRKAVIYSEIIGKPLSMRKYRR
ncbi:MAG: hypothetical protein Q4P34_07420 [Tissierellia bacterium]|nr:hypothetical protein [Tissierellia bacterium]